MTEVTKQITVYDSYGDGMSGTKIRFNDGAIHQFNLTFEGESEKVFNKKLFCGENTYQCRGTFKGPNWAEENSFKIEGDEERYECTRECIRNKCTFNIACENPKKEIPGILNNLFLATMEQCSDAWKDCGDTTYSTVEEFVADLGETEFNDVYLKCLKLYLNKDEHGARPFSATKPSATKTTAWNCFAPCRPPAKIQGVWGCERGQ